MNSNPTAIMMRTVMEEILMASLINRSPMKAKTIKPKDKISYQKARPSNKKSRNTLKKEIANIKNQVFI
jgi:hypothetical protein